MARYPTILLLPAGNPSNRISAGGSTCGPASEARSERKAKLQVKIDKLKADRQKKKEHAHQRSEQIRKEYDAKVQSLKEKAAKAHGAAKATLEARMAEMKKNHDAAVSKWKIWEGERLEKTADRLNDKARKLRMET